MKSIDLQTLASSRSTLLPREIGETERRHILTSTAAQCRRSPWPRDIWTYMLCYGQTWPLNCAIWGRLQTGPPIRPAREYHVCAGHQWVLQDKDRRAACACPGSRRVRDSRTLASRQSTALCPPRDRSELCRAGATVRGDPARQNPALRLGTA